MPYRLPPRRCLPLLFALCAADAIAAPACTGVEQPSTRLFLQQVTDHGAILRWRGDAAAVCIGTAPERLERHIAASTEGGHRQAVLAGLEPDTVYYYSVGGAARGVPTQWFRTAPKPGERPRDGNTHIWLLGDSGTATENFRGHASHQGEAKAVKEGFLRYNREQAGDEPVDLVLLLGDNAYLEGTDAQWQGAFFEIYPEILRNAPTWPTIGNHEMGAAMMDICSFAPMPQCMQGPLRMPMGGASRSADPASYDSDGNGPDAGGMPYLSIFNLPAGGEAGGVPSGTEQYYAFDHGNVHIVSLDSQLSNRDPAQREAMRQWLVADLAANARDWTVVVFHHPPLSKGRHHDSDREREEITMREVFGPVFQDHGVDVVYSGHSHSYERSWYLRDHFGPSASFDPARNAELNAAGKPAIGQGEEQYAQISRSSRADDKVVYTVAGSSGKTDTAEACKPGQTMGCSAPDWLMHPAHRSFEATAPYYRAHGIARQGSVVLDAGEKTLTSRFVDLDGKVLDWFTITR